jgi:hypothetical protein
MAPVMIQKYFTKPGIAYLILACVTSVLLITPAYTIAAPTGEDLLAACTDSLENGFETMEGKMCIWYVTPCNCDTALPQVCLPEESNTDRLARDVVEGLTGQMELQQTDAAHAATLILSNKYPCTGN